MATLRFGVLVILGIVAMLTVAACGASAPAPSPTSSDAKPSASTAPASASTSPAAKPAASDDWKAEWDKVLAEAKKEGKVVVAGGRGDPYALAASAFQKAYPDIQLEFTGVEGSSFAPKILAEREGGQFLWDVHFGGANTAFTTLIPKGVLDPIRPALLLPEVKDESKWLGGFDGMIGDKAHQYVLSFEGRRTFTVWVNRDLVPESQLNDPNQLLEPSFKGKIIALDMRIAGSGSQHAGLVYATRGEEWFRKLYSQDLAIVNLGRQSLEAIVRGTHMAAIAINAADIEQYKREGLGLNVHPLTPDSPGMSAVTSGFGNLQLVNKAPHPNAARVFINWLLSIEGQKAYVEATGLNSRRLDVKGPELTTPKPGLPVLASEEFQPNISKAQAIAKELIK